MNKSWIITEKYVGWGTATVIAETKEEALIKYEGGDYLDYEHDLDNAQDYEFCLTDKEKQIMEANNQ